MTSDPTRQVHQQERYLREIDLHYQEKPAAGTATTAAPDDVGKTCHLREIQLRVRVRTNSYERELSDSACAHESLNGLTNVHVANLFLYKHTVL